MKKFKLFIVGKDKTSVESIKNSILKEFKIIYDIFHKDLFNSIEVECPNAVLINYDLIENYEVQIKNWIKDKFVAKK